MKQFDVQRVESLMRYAEFLTDMNGSGVGDKGDKINRVIDLIHYEVGGYVEPVDEIVRAYADDEEVAKCGSLHPDVKEYISQEVKRQTTVQLDGKKIAEAIMKGRYPHVSESMFNGLLNQYGVREEAKEDIYSQHCMMRPSNYIFKLPNDIADALGILNDISFPETLGTIFYQPMKDIDVTDALEYGYENLYKQSKERDSITSKSLVDSFAKDKPRKRKPEPLLTIELQDESSVPKVIYKGKEVKLLLSAQFDYNAGDKDIHPEFNFDIEHHQKSFIKNRIGMTKTLIKGND